MFGEGPAFNKGKPVEVLMLFGTHCNACGKTSFLRAPALVPVSAEQEVEMIDARDSGQPFPIHHELTEEEVRRICGRAIRSNVRSTTREEMNANIAGDRGLN